MEKKSKVVKMDSHKEQVNKNPEKMSYEQLEQIAYNLNRQCQQLQAQVHTMQRVIDQFNEIGVLFDVLGKSDYFTEAFVSRCANKIEELVSNALDNSERLNNKSDDGGENLN